MAPTKIEDNRKSSGNQLFARKSIDKLIAESEEPEHRLKKSLGPWSLTALGIGAIIGSGIFVLTGTAAAGEHFEVGAGGYPLNHVEKGFGFDRMSPTGPGEPSGVH